MNARLKQLRDQRAAVVKEANDALDVELALAEKETRAPSDEAMKAQEGFNKRVADLDATIKAQEMRLSREGAKASVPDAGDLDEAIPAKGRRTGTSTPAGGFAHLGDMLQAVRETAVNPRGEGAGRLYAAAAGASESIESDGGFLVQQQWGGTLLQQVYETGVLARDVRRTSLGAEFNSIKYNLLDETSRANGSRFGGIQVFWAAEADAATATKPKLRRIELAPKKMIGLMYATDELLEDATAMEGFVNEWFPSEFGFKLDDAIFQGTGAGQPLGFMNSPAKVTITKESGQATKTINATNVEKMFAAMLPFSMGNARWYINVETLPQLFQMYHAIGTAGVPVYLPAGGISGGPYGSLFGRPVQAIEQTAALGTEGDIVLVDPQRYLLVDKGPIESAASIHVKFLTDESVFRWTVRVDGMPIPNSALTPYKGAQALSPFVTLQTR